MSATEARRHFGQLMRDVMEKNDIFIIERLGVPKMVIMSIAEYKRRGGKLDDDVERNDAQSEI